MNLLAKSASPVWLLTLVGAIVVGLVSQPAFYLIFLPVILGGVVILTFVVQLGLSKPEGFVDRVAASIAGSLVILAVATAILGPLS